jgi:hypothetical protein
LWWEDSGNTINHIVRWLNLIPIGLPGGYGRLPQPQNFRKRKLSSIEQMVDKTVVEK